MGELQLDLEERIARLEAVEAIKHLKARYCAYCDNKYNPEGLASLFIEEGIWDGETFGRYVGRGEIQSFLQRTSDNIIFAAHLVLNPIIEIGDADHAVGQWRLIMPATIQENGQKEARWLVAAYDERYVRRDSTWFFELLKLHVNFYEPHGRGWAHSAVP
jgi:SnoaL-like domain